MVHKAGFSGGRVQNTKTVREEDETLMCKVKLDHGGEIITIEEDSVEKVSQLIIRFLSNLQLQPPLLSDQFSKIPKVSKSKYIWNLLYVTTSCKQLRPLPELKV